MRFAAILVLLGVAFAAQADRVELKPTVDGPVNVRPTASTDQPPIGILSQAE